MATHGASWIRGWAWYGNQAVTEKGVPQVRRIKGRSSCVHFPAGGSRVSQVETWRSQPGSLLTEKKRKKGQDRVRITHHTEHHLHVPPIHSINHMKSLFTSPAFNCLLMFFSICRMLHVVVIQCIFF